MTENVTPRAGRAAPRIPTPPMIILASAFLEHGYTPAQGPEIASLLGFDGTGPGLELVFAMSCAATAATDPDPVQDTALMLLGLGFEPEDMDLWTALPADRAMKVKRAMEWLAAQQGGGAFTNATLIRNETRGGTS